MCTESDPPARTSMRAPSLVEQTPRTALNSAVLALQSTLFPTLPFGDQLISLSFYPLVSKVSKTRGGKNSSLHEKTL